MKYTVDFILEYFSHYNTQLYVDFEELATTILPYQKELEKVFNFLDNARNKLTDNFVNTYYLKDYFSYNYFGERTAALNITQFLIYAIGEFESLKDDFETELQYYENDTE